MTRNQFFATIAAALAGAGVIKAQPQAENRLRLRNACTIPDAMQKQVLDAISQRCPPVNGQCPVCGTMAEPFVLPLFCNTPTGQIACTPSPRVTRCARCSAAFWQDSVLP